MARTAFSAHIVYPNTYTVPAGKYAVFNAFASSTNSPSTQGGAVIITQNGTLIYNGDAIFGGVSSMAVTVGPFTANAGDVFSTTSATRGGVTVGAGEYGINGFLYDTSSVKIPFTSVVTQNSTSYTVPAGKVAVFNAFGMTLAEMYINSTPTAFIPDLFGIVNFYYPFDKVMSGPFAANAGDIISAGSTYASYAIGAAGGVVGVGVVAPGPGQFAINGFLYPP